MVNLVTTVWAVLAMVGVLVLGAVLRLTKVFSLKDIAPLNRFVFAVGIPCLAFKSMATRNIRTLDWQFVLAFGAVRAVGCLASALYTLVRRQSLGDFAVHYLASTWMDAITFGIPVATAMFNSSVGTLYPVLAALSSFVFELPIILISFEVHQSRLRSSSVTSSSSSSDSQSTESTALTTDDDAIPVAMPSTSVMPLPPSRWKNVRRIFGKVLLHVVKMPPLIGIILGIIYSALPTSLTHSKLPSVVDTFCTTVGACVTPLATFNVGLFVCDGQPFKRVWKRTLVYLPLKHLALPLVAIGVARLFQLGSPAGEIAVIVASLPLAFPAFTLVHVYQGLPQADDIMSTCISAGCVLLLPVVALWTLFLQKVPLFPADISSSSLP